VRRRYGAFRWPPGASGGERRKPVSAGSRKNLGVASVVLGLIAWMGEKFDVIPRKVAEWINLASIVTGAIAKFA
jgi:hypothetical protein